MHGVARLLLVAAVVTLVWEIAPPAMQHLSVLGRRLGERERFAAKDMYDMVQKYPTFMTRVADETVDELSRGRVWPVLERAWSENSWVNTVRAVANWVANNFVVRILSPQTPWECAGLIAVLFVVAVVAWGVLNLIGAMYMANTMRLNAEVKRASKTQPARFLDEDS